MKHINQGFTLVEFVLATFISTALVAGVAIMGAYYFQNYALSFEEQQAISHAQFASTNMVREIREARPGDNGAWPLIDLQDDSFVFYSDVTNDGRSDRVRYFLDGTQLKKGIIEPTQVPVNYPPETEKISSVADFMDNGGQTPIFSYYNGDWPGDQTNNPLVPAERLLNTRYVAIYLKVNVTPDNYAQPFELISGVQIRSLKDNL